VTIRSEIAVQLEADERFKRIEGKMLSRGMGGCQLNLDMLVLWCVWRINSVGKREAFRDLDHFLSSPEIDCNYVLWLYGVTIDKSLSIDKNITITPLKEMPNSDDKERFIQFSQDMSTIHPTSALKFASKTPKIPINEEPGGFTPPDEPRRLYDAAALLNALDDTFCFPGYQTAYFPESVPLGAFGGGGGGSELHDVLPRKVSKLSASKIRQYRSLITSFSTLTNKERRRFHLILRRLGTAKAKQNSAECALDLGICTEIMLLGDDQKNRELPDSLSHRLRTRGAWLLGRNPSKREIVFNNLRDIYTARSQVAHAGELSKKKELKKEHFDLASEIARKLIRFGGVPSYDKWLRITLGERQQA